MGLRTPIAQSQAVFESCLVKLIKQLSWVHFQVDKFGYYQIAPYLYKENIETSVLKH